MRGRIRIAIACAGLLATTAAGARAQTTFRETGSVTVGGYVVWVRGTSSNVVQLFVGRGFRDAFAPAHEMDAAKLQQWIDSVRAIVPLRESDSSAVDAGVHGSTIGMDVTMLRRVGGPFSGLRLLVNGEEPITMAEPTARDFIAALDSAARAAHELTPESVMAHMLPGDAPAGGSEQLPAGTIAVVAETHMATGLVRDTMPVPAGVVAVAQNPAAATTTIAAAPLDVAPRVASPLVVAPPAVASTEVAPPAVAPPVAAPPVVLAAAAPAPDTTTALPAPDLVLPTPREPVILLASRVDIMPLALPQPAMPKPIVVKAPPVVVAEAPAPAPAVDTVVAPHPEVPADKLIHTPLGPFTIPAALLADRDKEAQYCYTQLGLKYNPDLKGEITVKVLVSGDGAVQDAVVTKRSWQGISAGEVEACVRALAHDWTFASNDPSVTGGAKLLTFTFAPQVASAP